MTEDEALAALAKYRETLGGDPEAHHSAVDDLMIEIFKALGWARFAEQIEEDQENWWWA